MAIILKKLGSPIMTNLYYGTIKQLLERISSVMIDREAIQHLVGLVKEVNYLTSLMLKYLFSNFSCMFSESQYFFPI